MTAASGSTTTTDSPRTRNHGDVNGTGQEIVGKGATFAVLTGVEDTSREPTNKHRLAVTAIDTASENGSWAETLASPSCKVAVSHRRLTLPLRPTVQFVGSPNRGIEVSPVNSPAVTDNQGGGHFGSFHHHEADNG